MHVWKGSQNSRCCDKDICTRDQDDSFFSTHKVAKSCGVHGKDVTQCERSATSGTLFQTTDVRKRRRSGKLSMQDHVLRCGLLSPQLTSLTPRQGTLHTQSPAPKQDTQTRLHHTPRTHKTRQHNVTSQYTAAHHATLQHLFFYRKRHSRRRFKLHQKIHYVPDIAPCKPKKP